jgi:hypothetical protein
MPLTIPDNISTVAILILLLLQVPPVAALLSVRVVPTQIVALPVIGCGFAFIITCTVIPLVKVPDALQVPVPAHVKMQ